MPSGIRLLIPVFLAAAVVVQTSAFRWSKSGTYDETFYLSCAVQTLGVGDLDPALAGHGTAALPILLCWLPALVGQDVAERRSHWYGTRDDPPLVSRARLVHALVLGVPLVLGVYVWLLRRCGLLIAAWGGGMATFSPSIIAHGALATTDASSALFWLLALAAIAGFAARPSMGRLTASAAATGLAISAKYSGVFLLPVFLMASLRTCPWGRWRNLRRAPDQAARSTDVLPLVALIWRPLLFGYLALMVCWAVQLFAVASIDRAIFFDGTSSEPWWVRRLAGVELPSPLVGVICQYLHNLHGHKSYLMGNLSEQGWWYYFPCAAFFKSTPSELVLAGLIFGQALVAAGGCIQRHRSDEAASGTDPVRFVWWSALAVYAAMILALDVQIGHRYLLPIYPVVILLGADAVAALGRWRRVAGVTVGALLLGVQCVSALSVSPHYLSYFSPLVGGPERGHRLLGDSNLDWGQDLPELERQLSRLGDNKVVLSYFGTALPEAYGVAADRFDENKLDPLEGYDYLAVSVSNIVGLKPQRGRFDRRFQFLQLLEPDLRAGYTIWLFDIEAQGLRDRYQAHQRRISAAAVAGAHPH